MPASITESGLRSFVAVDPDSHFPIQNLPWCVFRPTPDDAPRIGTRIGDFVLDLAALETRGLLADPALDPNPVFNQPTLNAFMALGPAAWHAARTQLTRLLRHDVATLRDDAGLRALALRPVDAVRLELPARIGQYTDFYTSIHHATTVGRIFRGPDAALAPNFRHLPIAYHARASSLVLSGTPVQRPTGPFRPDPAMPPIFGPTRELDFELELGVLIGPGNPLGQPIPIAAAADHIFGLVLVNDWSARDIQQWEYQPLGPFLGKNFATTISPWVVPLAALEPFRCDGPAQDPSPLPYLCAPGPQAFDIALEVTLQCATLPAPYGLGRTNFRTQYWSLAQMIAHHTCNGCNLQPADLLATGTISGPSPDSRGCLLELTERGRKPLVLPDGTRRTFLADGDTISMTGVCTGPDYHIGFGECRGTIVPARST